MQDVDEIAVFLRVYLVDDDAMRVKAVLCERIGG
jgi:hypothetical protein